MMPRSRPFLLAALALVGAALPQSARGQATSTPTVTPSPSPTVSVTASVSPTATFVRTPTLPPRDVSGTYQGGWASPTGAGGLTLTLTQNGDAVTGTAIFSDHPCLGLARVSGRASGNAITGTLSSLTSIVMGNVRWTTTPAGIAGTFSLLTGCTVSANGTISVNAGPPSTPRGTASATPTRAAVTATPTATPSATQTPSTAGDCDGDGAVTVDEIVAMVSIALSTRPPGACPAADVDGDGNVTVDEILRGVFTALSGIPTGEVPPPTVQRCLEVGGAGCVCRGTRCCLAGSCAAGEPCRASEDCRLGLRCEDDAEGAVCRESGVVVPPPR